MNTSRFRWEAGLCPCCGQPRDNDGTDGTGPAVVAEGVWLCGWCIEHGHADEDVLPVILWELANPTLDRSS